MKIKNYLITLNGAIYALWIDWGWMKRIKYRKYWIGLFIRIVIVVTLLPLMIFDKHRCPIDKIFR